MKIQHIVSFLLIAMAVACRNGKQTETYPLFPEEPSRTAYEGFTWEKVSGAGIQLWAQRNPNIHIVLDDNSQSAFVERGGEQPSRWMVIKVFTLKDKNIDDVLRQLQQSPEWDTTQTCAFEEGKSNRKGVKRYDLVPTGDYAKKIQDLSSQEPIPSTCNGWGMGNSGIRYFEIHDNYPDKAIFLEIGQEAPLFDEQSIVLTEN
ncbi:MAG TPA: hypothetical protein IAA49_03620 [Candidatus Alistipes pullicola]|nr:hypothetical protein [Candidatus Alistipes pullicola]